jgi:hypothetical protein
VLQREVGMERHLEGDSADGLGHAVDDHLLAWILWTRSQFYDFWIYNLQLQRLPCSRRLDSFTMRGNNFLSKTRNAISCFVNFYNGGVVARDRRIGPSFGRNLRAKLRSDLCMYVK